MSKISKFAVTRAKERPGFPIRNSKFREGPAFTILELLIVISIIVILAALILGTVGYVQTKAARSRAEAEIAAMSAACESYKADNGTYPMSASTNSLKANSDGDPTQTGYLNASLYLYEELTGDHNNDRATTSSDDASGNGVTPKTYLTFRPTQLLPAPPSTASVTAVCDPFGNSYGYSTAKAAAPTGSDGYNPTFDLWTTCGATKPGTGQTWDQYQAQWIKNW